MVAAGTCTTRPLSPSVVRLPLLAVAAMVGSAACWGFGTVISKGALSYVPPFTLLVVQLAASVAFLWTAIVVTGQRAPLDAGAVAPRWEASLNPDFRTPSGRLASSLPEPLLVILIAWTMFRVRPRLATIMAIGVAVPGVVLVTTNGADGAQNSLLGDALVVLGVVFASVYVVLSSRIPTKVAALPIAALQQSVGLAFAVLLMTVVFASGIERPDFASVSPTIWLLAIGAGVLQYAIAFWLYLFGAACSP